MINQFRKTATGQQTEVSFHYALSIPPPLKCGRCGYFSVGGIKYTPSMSQTQFFLVYEGILTCMDQKDASFWTHLQAVFHVGEEILL